MCLSMDENDDLKVYENLFFDLFCFNEYVQNIYNNNKADHFKIILENNGFNLLDEDGNRQKINKSLKK